MSRNVGKMGERAFAMICEQAGLKAHRPDEDLFGWDFLVEQPRSKTKHLGSLDAAPPPLEFRVQVKSTDGTNSDVDISLSHMHRLSGLQMPVFFCFLAFDGGAVPVRMHLVHLGAELIARTLARVRELSAAGNNDLQKHTISVRYRSADAVEAPLHEGFSTRIVFDVPNGMMPYLAWKQQVLATVGYDERRFTASFTFEPMMEEDLFDFYLGIREEVKSVDSHTVEHRFGIPAEVYPKFCGPATLRIINHHPCDAAIIIRKDEFSQAIEFPAKAFRPMIVKQFPREKLKLRFVASIMELHIWPFAEKIAVKNTPRCELEYTLTDLADYFRALKWLSSKKTDGCLTELLVEGRLLLAAKVKISSAIESTLEYEALTAAALKIAQHIGITQRVRASLDELMRYEAEIISISSALSGAAARVEFDRPTERLPGGPIGFIKPFAVPIGNFLVVGVFAIIGELIVDGARASVETGTIRIIRAFGVPRAEDWDDDVLDSLVSIASDELSGEDIIPVAA